MKRMDLFRIRLEEAEEAEVFIELKSNRSRFTIALEERAEIIVVLYVI